MAPFRIFDFYSIRIKKYKPTSGFSKNPFIEYSLPFCMAVYMNVTNGMCKALQLILEIFLI